MPILIDLFCCAGGAAMGYHKAGFTVFGVDIKPQPNYPFVFTQADALNFDISWADAIHASPPCQGYTALKNAPGTKGAPKLIDEVRNKLIKSGKPYVIENVDGAKDHMINPVRLVGSMFGLGAQGCQLQRGRLFETNWKLPVPIDNPSDKPVIGVYGGHARKRSAKHGGRKTKDIWVGGHKNAAQEALGIDWMTLAEMSEAIPPAYTKYIGEQLKGYLDDH